MEEILKEIEELKKRVAALEGQVQAQPQKILLTIDSKTIAKCIMPVNINKLRIHHGLEPITNGDECLITFVN